MSASSIASARIGRWQITTAPAGWYFVPDFGLHHNTPAPASNIHLQDDTLLAGDKIEPYIEAQKKILLRTYDNPTFAGPKPVSLLADRVNESMMLLIRHQPMRGVSVLQVQTYVRLAKWLGIITLTTVDQRVAQVRPDYEQFIASLTIADEPIADEPEAGAAAGQGTTAASTPA